MSKIYKTGKFLAMALAMAMAVVPHSYAIFGFGDDDDAAKVEGRSVWRSGEQYVQIVPAGAPGNGHPANLDPRLLSYALQQVMAKEEKRFLHYGQYEPIPVFLPQMASTLGKALHKALGEATDGEEVIFLIQGSYKTLSILREVHGITGRVFYKDGKLNIIFGEILKSDQDSGNYNADLRGLDYETSKRSVNYKLATRERSVDSGWVIVPGEGMGTPAGAGERSDWLELDMQAIDVARINNPPEQELDDASTMVREEAQDERRQMLLDMARMRDDIKELRQGDPAAGQDAAQGSAATDVKHRLQTLKALHENELISDEEYQAKRREIIDQL